MLKIKSNKMTTTFDAPLPKPSLPNNTYTHDHHMQRLVSYYINNSSVKAAVSSDLTAFGQRCAKEIFLLGEECEANPPTLTTYDAWGKRVDEVNTCAAWRRLKDISAEEGLIATAYNAETRERLGTQEARFLQVMKLVLFAPSSGLFSCPLAMTDGAACVLHKRVVAGPTPGYVSAAQARWARAAYDHLTSRNPAEFWTSGQWMTERLGGSDVGRATQTQARPKTGDTLPLDWELNGNKWFTSSTEADITLTLARTDDTTTTRNANIAMFLLPTQAYWKTGSETSLNGLRLVALKDKLGTRQLPTGEMDLVGTRAMRVSDIGKGTKDIMTLANITRIHNVVSAAASMRRITTLAVDYARRRTVGGRTLLPHHPIHVDVLATMEVRCRAAMCLVAELAHLQGAVDAGTVSPQQLSVHRVLIPLAKMLTGKLAVAVASEGLECFGGMGFLENTGLPKILRDAQVLSIWEGTTTVMALDALRVGKRTCEEAVRVLLTEAKQSTTDDIVTNALAVMFRDGQAMLFEEAVSKTPVMTMHARQGAMLLARGAALALMAKTCMTKCDKIAAVRWAADHTELVPRRQGTQAQRHVENLMLLNVHPSAKL
eukprot:PhM_4_TR9220/c0_g1_i1/m.20823